MIRSCISILDYLTRLLASTAILPTALVAGMLSFPTTCQCGADQPHDHSIFGIAGHHHGVTRQDSRTQAEIIRAGANGVNVQAPMGAAAPALAVVQSAATSLQPLPRPSLAVYVAQMPDEYRAAPDVPPPQA